MHSRRRVLYIGGYDPVMPADFFARQSRHMQRFETTWDVTTEAAEPAASVDGAVWQRRIVTSAAEGWTTETDFRLLAWDDLIAADFARPLWLRMPLAFGVLADFLISGTVAHYFIHAWRFADYFLMPYVLSLCFVAAGAVAASFVLVLEFPAVELVAMLAAAAVFALLMRWPGRFCFVPHLLDCHTFLAQYLRNGRPDMTARLDRFAHELIEAASSGDIDELVVIGHSLGGVFALECVERALSIDPDCARRGTSIAILTVGSCVLQIGLHPAAKASFIPHLIRLRDEPEIDWVDFQAISDLANFYRTDPATLMGLGKRQKGDFPWVHLLRIRDMLIRANYGRVKMSLFRLHYQFVSGNTQRYWYDFYMICCGPRRIANSFMWRAP